MRSIKVLVGFCLLSQSLIACSNSQFLKSVNLGVKDHDSQSYVDLSAEIDMGNISFDGVTVPVMDPHHPEVQLGLVSLGGSASGKQLVTVSLNATALTKGDSTLGSTLPNGRAIPSSVGAPAGTMMGIQFLNHSRVYIGGDLKTSLYVGVALAISALDNIIGNIGNTNLFFGQNFNPSLSGVAGVYSSASAHENGIAIFARYILPRAAGASLVQEMKFGTRPSGSIEVSGISQTPNQVINDGMDKDGAEALSNYFYGDADTVSPE